MKDIKQITIFSDEILSLLSTVMLQERISVSYEEIITRMLRDRIQENIDREEYASAALKAEEHADYAPPYPRVIEPDGDMPQSILDAVEEDAKLGI